jgi:hypothetical protein
MHLHYYRHSLQVALCSKMLSDFVKHSASLVAHSKYITAKKSGIALETATVRSQKKLSFVFDS